jgi:hypothetical protein
VVGLTVTEPDAVNNPGQYNVAMTAASFLLSPGVYSLYIFVTASPADNEEQSFIVTATGNGSGLGSLSFTATASDGRVMSGGSPVNNATVTLTSGSFAVTTQTNSSGLWGPVYFQPSFGTVTIHVQKSGYDIQSDTLSVGASSITGPAADITLNTVNNSSSLLASELIAFAKRMAGNKTGTQAETKAYSAVNDAADMLSRENDWSWYIRKGYLSLVAPYATGTIAITTGTATVTLTTGTWPSWAEDGKLFTGSKIYDVETRTSDSVIVLSGTYNGDTVTADSFIIFQDEYALPANLARFGYILPGQAWAFGGDPTTIEQLWLMQNAFTTGQAYPSAFAVANGNLTLYPYPSDNATIAYTYRVRPTSLVNDSDTLDMDPTYIECLRKAICYQVAVQFGECVAGTAEDCYKMYKESLGRIPSNDKQPVNWQGSSMPGVVNPYRRGHIVGRWY